MTGLRKLGAQMVLQDRIMKLNECDGCDRTLQLTDTFLAFNKGIIGGWANYTVLHGKTRISEKRKKEK